MPHHLKYAVTDNTGTAMGDCHHTKMTEAMPSMICIKSNQFQISSN